jgi:hypothetical protein
MSTLIGAVPVLPTLVEGKSPQVVLAMDRIRRDLEDTPDFDEFCLFAREYPRCYRFHFDGATFRLRSMHTCLSLIHKKLATQDNSRESTFEVGLFDPRVNQLYWDFESYLSEVNVALDLLARVVGPAFKQQSPPSFNKLCKQSQQHVLLNHFRRAKMRWVNRLKDYRDCFMHYTPVDNRPVVMLRRYSTGWELHTRLPVNPNVREMLGFKFSRRVDLMRYAITTYKHLTSFDRAIARSVLRLYRTGDFPVRKTHLFFVGQRTR